MSSRHAAPRAASEIRIAAASRRASRLDVADTELATARVMLEVTTAELEACQAERDRLQIELGCARVMLQTAHEEVSELGRLVKSVVLGSRRRG
jgi:hypothetical protein